MKPSMATNPNGTLNVSRNNVTPIKPSGAVSSTRMVFDMLCRWIISKVTTTRSAIGTTAFTDSCPRALSSVAPPISMW